MKIVRIYKTLSGAEPFTNWIDGIRDKSIQTRIRNRIDRLYFGNEGDHKSIGKGVFELRLDFGSGYRVYYAKENNVVVILLCGGDKKTQRHDIELAYQYWAELKKRDDHE